MRISELSRKFLLWSSARGASPRTTESYEATYSRFVEFLHQRGEDDDLRHFTPEHIEAFIDALVAGGLKPSSVRRSARYPRSAPSARGRRTPRAATIWSRTRSVVSTDRNARSRPSATSTPTRSNSCSRCRPTPPHAWSSSS
jgi:hypothetical protein